MTHLNVRPVFPFKFSYRGLVGLAVFLLAGSFGALAEDDHDEKRHASAHQHGEAQLNIALDGESLTIEFVSPAINLVGFEHEAANEAEVARVQNAVAHLHNDTALFRFKGGSCQLEGAQASAEGLLPESEHAGHEGSPDGHSEFEAAYLFRCAMPEDLKVIQFGFFDLWPGIEEIEMVFIGVDIQLRAELTAASPQIELAD